MNVLDLWLPIVLAGLATHVISTIAWTAMPHHKPEWQRLSVERDLIEWLDSHQVPAGQYLFPHTHDMAEMKSESFQQLQGKCRGMLVLWPTVPNMGVNIALTLAFFLVIAFVLGYLAAMALPVGAPFARVFQFVLIAALLTHCAGQFPGVIWFRKRVGMDLLDKMVQSVVTALIFASLWPGLPS